MWRKLRGHMRSTNRYIKSNKLYILIFVIFFAFTFTSCYKKEEVPVLAPASTEPSAQMQAGQNLLPDYGGELKIPMPDKPDMNPLKAQNMYMANIFSVIFESLVTIDIDGRAQPCLAETWDVSLDKKVWLFHLRKGIQWQNDIGELKASDVAFTLNLLKDIQDEESIYAGLKSMIAEATPVDDYTLRIVTNEPRGALLYSMVFPVLPENYYKDTSDLSTKQPAGSGPYRLEKITDSGSNAGMTLVANDKWWKKKPFIQTIKAVQIQDNDNEIELARYKDTDELNFVTTASLTSGKYRVTDKTDVSDYMTQYYDALIPNLRSSVFADVNIRKALAYAIDKSDIISRALLNHAAATDFPIPPDSWLYQVSIYEYNTATARDLLEKAGWKDVDGDGIAENKENKKLTCNLLVLKTKDITYRIDVAKLIKEQLKIIGIDVKEIKEKTWEDVPTKGKPSEPGYKSDLASGNFDLALCSFWLGRYPDLSRLIKTSGEENYSGYASKTMDELLDKCATQMEDDGMKAAFGELQQAYMNDLPQIALYFRTNSAIYDHSIQVIGKLRELDIYHDISKWYMVTKKAG